MLILMTIVDKEKKSEKDVNKNNENLIFDLEQDFTLTKNEVNRLKKSLETTNVNPNTRKFFQSAKDLYEKLKRNDFTITLEELAEKWKNLDYKLLLEITLKNIFQICTFYNKDCKYSADCSATSSKDGFMMVSMEAYPS